MPRLDILPAALLAPIETRADAETFLRALKAADLDYHFDDGAIDCLYRNGLISEGHAMLIDSQVDACYREFERAGADLRTDCPIGFMLLLMVEAGEIPAGDVIEGTGLQH